MFTKSKPTAPPAPQTLKSRLHAIPEIASAHKEGLEMIGKLNKFLDDYELELMEPAQAAKALKRIVEDRQSSPERINLAIGRLKELQVAGDELHLRARRDGLKFQNIVKEHAIAFVKAVAAALPGELEQARQTEQAFFELHGLPAERTVLSRRVEAMQVRAGQLLHEADPNNSPNLPFHNRRPTRNAYAAWFALLDQQG